MVWTISFRCRFDSIEPRCEIKYLKTLVTGKAKTAIANFAYCGAMYTEALKTLEKKFGQPQAVVGAYLDKLATYPAVKMHSSESIISYASTISSLVNVFQLLSYKSDLRTASLLNQAVSKLPPNMREGWSLHTVKRNMYRPTLLDFNTWLQEKSEAHDRMQATQKKSSSDKSAQTGAKAKMSKAFLSNVESSRDSNSVETSVPIKTFKHCIACKRHHPVWRCAVFKEKTPTQRAKIIAEHKLCFSCLNDKHSFRKCPNLRQCTKEGCFSCHNTLLHGAERIFPSRQKPFEQTQSLTNSSVPTREPSTQKPRDNNSVTLASKSDVKGLLQIVKVNLSSSYGSQTAWALSDSACSHSWMTRKLTRDLKLEGRPICLTVNGINYQEVVTAEMVELNLSSVDRSRDTYKLSPYLKENMLASTSLMLAISIPFTHTLRR